MLKHGIRMSVAIVTFSLGIALMWPLKLVQRLETALVDRFYDLGDNVLRPISLTADPAEDANEIYRLLIQHRFPRGQAKSIVIRSEPVSYELFLNDAFEPEWKRPGRFYELMNQLMPEAEKQTLDNYLLRTKNPEQLKLWNLGLNCVMATNSELLDDMPGDFWVSFYKKYPNSAALLSFSNVGFNDRRDQALVYAVVAGGYTYGDGAYVLFRKVNGKWEIQRDEGLWIS